MEEQELSEEENLDIELNFSYGELFDSLVEAFEMFAGEKQKKIRFFNEEDKKDLIEYLKQQGIIGKDVVHERIVYQEKPFKTPQHVLDYQKDYRKFQKFLKQKDKKEFANKEKIKKALERKILPCYNCGKGVFLYVPVINLTHEIETNVRSTKKKIIIKGKCSICGEELRGYGGFLL